MVETTMELKPEGSKVLTFFYSQTTNTVGQISLNDTVGFDSVTGFLPKCSPYGLQVKLQQHYIIRKKIDDLFRSSFT